MSENDKWLPWDGVPVGNETVDRWVAEAVRELRKAPYSNDGDTASITSRRGNRVVIVTRHFADNECTVLDCVQIRYKTISADVTSAGEPPPGKLNMPAPDPSLPVSRDPTKGEADRLILAVEAAFLFAGSRVNEGEEAFHKHMNDATEYSATLKTFVSRLVDRIRELERGLATTVNQ